MRDDQPRWPAGTPTGPGGKGPGGGRFRSGPDALATPPLSPLRGVTTGIFDRGFADLDERTQAFVDFRGAGFSMISAAANGDLANPHPWAPELAQYERARRYAAAIKRTMEESRLPHGIQVYRGVGAGYLFGPATGWPGDMTGREWTDTRYVSTSANSGVGEPVAVLRPRGWQGGRSAMDFVDRATQLRESVDDLVHMTIRVPAGVGAVQLSPWEDEAEVLLDRGLRYRVVADHGWETFESQDGPARVRMLDVEVIPGDWADHAARLDV